VIETFTFTQDKVCSLNGIDASRTFSNLQDCLIALGAMADFTAALAPNMSIAPDALAYVSAFKKFIWGAIAPSMISGFGLFSIPKFLRVLRR